MVGSKKFTRWYNVLRSISIGGVSKKGESEMKQKPNSKCSKKKRSLSDDERDREVLEKYILKKLFLDYGVPRLEAESQAARLAVERSRRGNIL